MIGPIALAMILLGGVLIWAAPRFRGSYDRGAFIAEGGGLVIGGLMIATGIVLLMLKTAFSAELVSACVVNPDVTQENIATTICVPDWTKTIRPPASYTNDLKAKQLGVRPRSPLMKQYEEDHACPLELGGHPRDSANLHPQKWTGPWNAHIKDRLENRLHKLVCAGEIDLATAQQEISTDWIASYRARMK